jgi:trehalose/maltose hydrolase-like predicted phosphorylase
MHEALEPTRDPGWLLSHQGYNVLTESAVESSLAFGNGFLGMRAARSVSRGPTWVAWLGYSRWASWPRCYVAGLFDMPNTEPPVPALVPVADWSRVRILLDEEPLLARFAGLDLRGDTLGIDPRLPPQWRSLAFRVCWRGRSVAIRITGSTVQATLVDGEVMEIRIAATTRKLTAGAPVQVSVQA